MTDNNNTLEENKPELKYIQHFNMNLSDARKILETFSSISTFDDNQWLIDKANEDQNLTNKQRRVNFLNIENDNTLMYLKFFALMRLMKRHSTRSVAHSVLVVREFLNATVDPSKELSEMNALDIFGFYNHLFNSNSSTRLKSRLEKWFLVKEFFKVMNFQDQYQIMEKYTTENFPDERRVDTKYIPEEVASKMDVEFLKDEIPLAFKLIYWLLRLLPNRIMEVLSMRMNCVKKLDDDYYMISIPTFKQTGPYSLGNIKLIEVKYSGIGKYLIDLIYEFIDERKADTDSDISDDDFLFYAPRCILRKVNATSRQFVKGSQYERVTIDRVNYFFKNFCKLHYITQDDGTPYVITSHQFRHNATSDRINSGIFRAIDVQGLTYHHSTAMIDQTYTHQDKDTIINNAPVVFKGRIINTDNERKLNQLLKKPYAKNIYKLGICSDVRVCNKDKSQCLRCDYMIPDVDDLDYYTHELNDWISKRDKAKLTGNSIFMELCEDWINSYQIVITKVLNAITNENMQNMEVSYGKHEQEHAEDVRREAASDTFSDTKRN